MNRHNNEGSKSSRQSTTLEEMNHSMTSHDIPTNPLYAITFNTLTGESLRLIDYQDHTLLIVNTASNCGFTPQYRQLESLYQTYRDQGLLIIGTPCNQFGQQEPGGSEEIQNFCSLNYQVSFPMTEKLEVNGEDTHPLYQILKTRAPGLLNSKGIKWNFTKFLISPKAEHVDRYSSMTNPKKMELKIRQYLSRT